MTLSLKSMNQAVTGKCVITNEVGGIADVLAVVKRASAKVVKSTPVFETEYELAA